MVSHPRCGYCHGWLYFHQDSRRDAVFFNQGGHRDLPLVYILMAIVSVPGAMIHLWAIKRWGARKVRTGVLLVAASIFFAFVPFVDFGYRTAMTAMFVLIPAVFAGAWLLAADLLDGADERVSLWAYTRIGASSMIGGVAGGLLAGRVSSLLPSRFGIVATTALAREIQLGLKILLYQSVVGWWGATPTRTRPTRGSKNLQTRHSLLSLELAAFTNDPGPPSSSRQATQPARGPRPEVVPVRETHRGC